MPGIALSTLNALFYIVITILQMRKLSYREAIQRIGGKTGSKPRHSDSSAKATGDYTDRSEEDKDEFKVSRREVCNFSKQMKA